MELTTAFNIDRWDAIIIGDGSGTTREHTCGWGSILIEKSEPGYRAVHGGFSSGTNNVAEMMAVLQPLMELTAKNRGTRALGFRVHVFSDSEYVVSGLRHDSPLWASSTNANRELWLAIHGARRNGMVITPHHVPRDQLLWQKLCHNLANEARLRQKVTTEGISAVDSILALNI